MRRRRRPRVSPKRTTRSSTSTAASGVVAAPRVRLRRRRSLLGAACLQRSRRWKRALGAARRSRGSCAARACASRDSSSLELAPARRRGGARARAGGRCGRAPRCSSSRRRAGSTSSRRSCARTSARASSAAEQRLQLLQRTVRAGLSGASPRAGARPRPRCRARCRPDGARRRLGQQADLLVVADRARRRADQPRDVADAQAASGARRRSPWRAAARAAHARTSIARVGQGEGRSPSTSRRDRARRPRRPRSSHG